MSMEDPYYLRKPLMKETQGSYDTYNIKKSLGLNGNNMSGSMNPTSSMKIGQTATLTNFNDPSYHRTKNFNNYGYDVLTGVRKESPNRVL